MGDVEVTIVIIALALATGIFVGAVSPAVYGWATFFLCIGVFTLIYNLIKMAARR